MNFSEAFGLKANDLVAIIGSGGKTTLCLRLAKENTDKITILTTTTKMFPVSAKDLDLKDNFFSYYQKDLPSSLNKGVNVFGNFFKEKKVSSLSEKEFKNLHLLSDLFIYEADGAKCKSLKAWESFEPVILKETSVIIGVIPIFVLQQKVCEHIIHRFDIFCENFCVKKGDIIDEDLFVKIAFEMFKKSPKGARKILFLNRYESKYKKSLNILAEKLSFLELFYGSVKSGKIGKLK